MRPLLLHFEESSSAISEVTNKVTRQTEEMLTEIQRIVAGTKTLSEVRAETNDSDIRGIIAGTSTCTRVRAESNDTDPHCEGRHGLAIPT